MTSDLTEWRDIPSHPHYQASPEGDIYSRRTNRVLKPGTRADGYLSYNLSVDGVPHYVNGHRLVCEAYHGTPPDGKPLALHGNGVRDDNRAENLRWGNQSENLYDRVLHGNCHESAKTHCPQGHPYSSENTYKTKGGRKCKTCVVARNAHWKARCRATGLPEVSPKHGTRTGYDLYGCRCAPCTAANTLAGKLYRDKQKENNND